MLDAVTLRDSRELGRLVAFSRVVDFGKVNVSSGVEMPI